MKMKLYVCGPAELAQEAERLLHAAGYSMGSPMLACQAVATLESRGCIRVSNIAQGLGLPVKSVNEWLRLAAEVPEPKDPLVFSGSFCPHKNGVKNIRPWEGAGFSIGECVDCNSTIKVQP